MIRFGRVLLASGRRVSRGQPAGLENRHDEGSVLMRFWSAVLGALEAVRNRNARWQFLFGTLEAVLGTRRPFALRRFMKNCTRQYAKLSSPPSGASSSHDSRIVNSQGCLS